jgi:transposase
MKNYVIGIDVSKEKLDFCLQRGEKTLEEFIVENTTTAIKSSLKRVEKKYQFSMSDILLCAEYTGKYIYPLSCACNELRVDLWMEDPSQIKHRSGVQRGKNDRLDARKIAAYALRFQDKARLFSLPEKKLASLKQLINERDMYISDRGKYQGQLTDEMRFMSMEDYEAKSKRLKRQINELDISLEEIEQEIKQLIDSDDTLKHQYELLLSVDGIGKQTAVKMIVETNAFKDFKNGRQFCCHAGVAPFRYDSGTSIRSKSKVSHRADKSIKALLHLAALTVATRKKDGDLREYYIRKVAEGKNKMSVLNAIRAKLVLRMFAVIKFNKFYEQNYAFSFA